MINVMKTAVKFAAFGTICCYDEKCKTSLMCTFNLYLSVPAPLFVSRVSFWHVLLTILYMSFYTTFTSAVMAMQYFTVVHTHTVHIFYAQTCFSSLHAASCPESTDLLPAVIALSAALVVVILLLAVTSFTTILLYTSESSHIDRC